MMSFGPRPLASLALGAVIAIFGAINACGASSLDDGTSPADAGPGKVTSSDGAAGQDASDAAVGIDPGDAAVGKDAGDPDAECFAIDAHGVPRQAYCSPPTTCCSPTCVDTYIDPTNCGSCGYVCPIGKPTCSHGVCG